VLPFPLEFFLVRLVVAFGVLVLVTGLIEFHLEVVDAVKGLRLRLTLVLKTINFRFEIVDVAFDVRDLLVSLVYLGLISSSAGRS